eukprot:4029748-Prymnesium_polylepis.1
MRSGASRGAPVPVPHATAHRRSTPAAAASSAPGWSVAATGARLLTRRHPAARAARSGAQVAALPEHLSRPKDLHHPGLSRRPQRSHRLPPHCSRLPPAAKPHGVERAGRLPRRLRVAERVPRRRANVADARATLRLTIAPPCRTARAAAVTAVVIAIVAVIAAAVAVACSHEGRELLHESAPVVARCEPRRHEQHEGHRLRCAAGQLAALLPPANEAERTRTAGSAPSSRTAGMGAPRLRTRAGAL